MLILTSDHAGFELKEKIKKYLIKKGIEFVDDGPKEIKPLDDYPDYAVKASKLVLKNQQNKGVFICGTGLGMCITANKIKGIRASLVYNKNTAKLSVEHNNSNVICLGGRTTSFLKAKQIINTFLTSSFKGGKHQKRVEKINNLD